MEETKIFTAKKYSVRIKDFLKSLLMAAGTAAATAIQKMTDEAIYGTPAEMSKVIAMAAIGAAATYIIRKYFVDDVKLAKKTIEQSIKNEE